METINRATVCAYHVAATQYCEVQVQSKCVEWLERRLTSETSVSLLKDIRWVWLGMGRILGMINSLFLGKNLGSKRGRNGTHIVEHLPLSVQQSFVSILAI